MNDPGEYDSLPAAVVAEELGLSIGLVLSLIYCGEIEPTDKSGESAGDRVSRDELARVIEFGLDELLHLHEQVASQVFEDSMHHHNGIDRQWPVTTRFRKQIRLRSRR